MALSNARGKARVKVLRGAAVEEVALRAVKAREHRGHRRTWPSDASLHFVVEAAWTFVEQKGQVGRCQVDDARWSRACRTARPPGITGVDDEHAQVIDIQSSVLQPQPGTPPTMPRSVPEASAESSSKRAASMLLTLQVML